MYVLCICSVEAVYFSYFGYHLTENLKETRATLSEKNEHKPEEVIVLKGV